MTLRALAWGGVVPLTFPIPIPSPRPRHHVRVQVPEGIIANAPSRGMMRIRAYGIPLMREELSCPVRLQATAAYMGLRGGSAETAAVLTHPATIVR